ncbi:MAG: retroviral-like aspartic protease family protein [Gammaproteobacteria bacterium]
MTTKLNVITLLLTVLPSVFAASAVSADYDILLPIAPTAGGSYSVEARFGNLESADFLIDTGAGLSTVSRDQFNQLKRSHRVSLVRRVAARLANGKIHTADVYRIDNFTIAGQCNLGSVEMAVMPNAGRNIIGMDVLSKTAPFGMNLDQDALAVSRCKGQTPELGEDLAAL